MMQWLSSYSQPCTPCDSLPSLCPPFHLTGNRYPKFVHMVPFFLLRFYPVFLLWGEMISFAFLNNTFYTLAYFKTLNKWTRSLFLKRLTGLLCVVVILSFPLLWNIPPCAHTLGWKKFNLLFTGRLLLLPVIKNSAAIHQKHLLVMKGKKWGGENGHNLNKVIKINITEKGPTSCPSYTTSEKDAILLLWYSSHKTLIGI